MRRLFLPSTAIVAALVADLWIGEAFLARIPQPATQRFLLLATFLLAWRLRRGRVAWAAVALAALAEMPGLSLSTQLDVAPKQILLIAAGALLCLDLGIASTLKEWWLWSVAGAVRFAILGVQALLVFSLTLPAAEPARAMITNFGQSWSQRLPLPPLLAVAIGFSSLMAAIALWRRRSPLEAGLLAAIAAVTCGFAFTERWRYYLAAAGLCLLIALVENAFTLAFQDGLTGLPARRALEERLPQLGRTYALAMLDLDHFKKLNDRHGHEVGDQVLKLVAARLRKVTGGGESFRYGGEEFTVVFAGKTSEEATVHLDALRQRIASRPFTVRSPGRPAKKPAKPVERPKTVEKNLKVTVSIGVAERSDGVKTPAQVMKAADKALYKAKKAGRNRVATG